MNQQIQIPTDLKKAILAMLEPYGGVSALTDDTPPKHEYMTRKEVMDLLRVEKSTLWKLTASGKIQSVKFGAKKASKRLFLAVSVRSYLDSLVTS